MTFDGAIGIGGPAGIEAPVLRRLRDIFRPLIVGPEFEAECDQLLAPVMYLEGAEFRRYAHENAVEESALVRRLGARLGD